VSEVWERQREAPIASGRAISRAARAAEAEVHLAAGRAMPLRHGPTATAARPASSQTAGAIAAVAAGASVAAVAAEDSAEVVAAEEVAGEDPAAVVDVAEQRNRRSEADNLQG